MSDITSPGLKLFPVSTEMSPSVVKWRTSYTKSTRHFYNLPEKGHADSGSQQSLVATSSWSFFPEKLSIVCDDKTEK